MIHLPDLILSCFLLLIKTFGSFQSFVAKENFLVLSLENGFRVALRPSGTEPKLKFYIFGESESNPEDLHATKIDVKREVEELGEFMKEDSKIRSE